MKRFGAISLVAVLTFGCGDPETEDNRGYTKAPLEKPKVLIGGEARTAMDSLGTPIRPVAMEIQLPEEAAGGPADAADGTVADVQLPEGVTQEMVTAGEQIYSSNGNCMTCHGQGGAGTPLAPVLADGDWLHIDGAYDAIRQIIQAGVPQPLQFPAPMPPMGGAQLSDEQVRSLAAYVYALSHR